MAADFETWVREAEPRLRRAYAGIRGPDQVLDAVGEALSYAWEHWSEVQTMENPIGYVFRVGQSRTRSRRPLRLPPATEFALPDVEPTLVPALLSLPDNQRTAVWLVHACGWRHAEVAEAMSITPSTVSTHVNRGLASLRKALGVSSDA